MIVALTLLGCAEHLFSSRGTPCDGLQRLTLDASGPLSLDFDDREGDCRILTDSTVRPSWSDGHLELEGVEWAVLEGLPDGTVVEASFDGGLWVDERAAVVGLEAGDGDVVLDGARVELTCEDCVGSVTALEVDLMLDLEDGELAVCSDRDGLALLRRGSRLDLDVGDPRSSWEVRGNGEATASLPEGYEGFANPSGIAVVSLQPRTESCDGEPLAGLCDQLVCPDAGCSDQPACQECQGFLPCTVEAPSASIHWELGTVRIGLTHPTLPALHLGITAGWWPDDSVDLDAVDTCGDAAPGVASVCHTVATVGELTLSIDPYGDAVPNATTVVAGPPGAWYVLRHPDDPEQCWTFGDDPSGASPYPCPTIEASISGPPTIPPVVPDLAVEFSDTGVFVAFSLPYEVDLGMGQTMVELTGGDPWYGEACEPDAGHICHPLNPGGTTLHYAPDPASVQPGLTLMPFDTEADELTYIVRSPNTQECWVGGHDPSYYLLGFDPDCGFMTINGGAP